MDVIVEGWRFVPHSFAIANQFQLLEMLDRSEEKDSTLRVFHREMPYLDPNWMPKPGLFEAAAEDKLHRIPAPPEDLRGDATLRMFMPYNLAPSASKRTYVFGTTEWRIVQALMVKSMGVRSFEEAHRNSDTVIITPSNWSRQGFLNAGAVPERVVVVPHGVDTQVFRPILNAERERLRRQWGLDGCFAFLHIGVMTWNKGIRLLLKAFAAVTERYPHARLVLKGTDAIRKSREFVVGDLREMLTPVEFDRVLPRIAYIGKNLSGKQLARLHQVCDAYVAPYLAEGFNMPVLEAAACGLPVICTRGGSTDDFTHPSFTGYIDSKLSTVEIDKEIRYYLHPDLDRAIDLMSDIIEKPEFVAQARKTAPKFVASQLTWTHVVDRLLEVMAQKPI
ncbi:glycosyl transferase group 1 [Leptolyngbya valderiana BDU 20041]|nr:glycosyltransferase family 4 protein [Geitlerinema sp. CS-897]OAB61418.1 glycosyl transferase group 1 [Leptolyngbya valderiana BDU 20041]PPT10062.1 Glycosyltransferase [Geitlerinema sp. FC II]